MESATRLGLTGREYQWILTRTSIPVGKFAPKAFPVGMLGISFDYGEEAMKAFANNGMLLWMQAIQQLEMKPALLENKTIPPDFTCDSNQPPYWRDGEIIYRCVGLC
ncbi:ionotropic glutamate receptor NMDA 2-like protein [Elysia marginata]|uniref:Ionotropic glutamate receptor NMDA 2-like protein n=1 Tax=Elysia marginata TaxID=1093978 RepID=A0AAV4F774_9GAST|nr:ionotropic glutamate receptor NMDA 2-like protein [Elysia marginata]